MKSKLQIRADRSEALDHYNRLVALLADRIRSVAMGYQTGVYLVGRTGAGKTYNVRRTLDECKADYVILNGRVTPAALYDEIEESPDSFLVIDDVPLLFANPQAAQILMAAIGGDPAISRRVTYSTKARRRVTEFRGGIIAISNNPLRHDPASVALASRLVTLEHDPTDEMLIAFMASQARKGVKGIPPKECRLVLEHVVEVCRTGEFRIDLRCFFKALEDFRCWKSGACETDWRVLVQSSIRHVGADELPPTPVTRAGTKAVEYEIVVELHGRDLPRDVLEAEWRERTGKEMDSYYRRRRELALR